MNVSQTTVACAAEFSGIALHSGRMVRVRLSPLAADSGIIFCRTDLGQCVRAAADNVFDTRLATTLGDATCMIGTVEHLLSALSALSVDNLRVEVDGPELPIVDGSAAPWMLFITEACGLLTQELPRRTIRVKKEVSVTVGDGSARFMPTNGVVRYAMEINFPHAVVRQTGLKFSHTLSADNFEEEISRARTFCYVNDVDNMRRHRRALGGSLRCAVVYDDLGVLNADGLRYPDEFVRHKVLDAVGDCYINGNLIVGDYEAICPGHGLNHALVSALLADNTAWVWE